MFQSDLILWIQSFESATMTSLMAGISTLGYSIVYGILIVLIVFGFNLNNFYIHITSFSVKLVLYLRDFKLETFPSSMFVLIAINPKNY